jgi:CubicO group peptidase (beta-lactamase class C family)
MKLIRNALILLALATPASAQPGPQGGSRPGVEDLARMEQVIQSYVQNRTFMGTVLVAKGPDVLLSKGYGSANVEWEIPNTPATKFRLGSITKQFTAASILLLEERGKLSTADPIKKHMPDAPAAWDAVTIHHLLTHTSGIPNFTSLPDYATLKYGNTPVEKTIAAFKDKPLDFAVGERMAYSNSGYLVLGHVIEKLSGGAYAAFVQDNIFTPLGMKDSGYDSNTRMIPRRAAGYVSGPGGLANAGYVHMSVPHAAGALYSTTEDMLKWEQGLFGGKLLSAASLQKMTTPNKSDYAYGLVVRAPNGRKQVWHNGGIDGFNTSMAYYPDTQFTIVVLGNVNGPVPDQLAAQLGALAHGDPVILRSERKEIPLPAAAANYVGVYEMAPGITMTISLTGGKLYGQMTGQGQIEMFAESETAFFVKVVDAQFDFVSAGGAVTHLVLHQGGRDLKGVRK